MVYDPSYQAKYYVENRDKINARRVLAYRKDPVGNLLKNAKRRARELKLAFNIDRTDIGIPEQCPLLGIKLEVGADYRANTAKNNLTLAELRTLVTNLELHYGGN